MANVREIFETLNEFAPVSMKMDFDNVGFLVGEADREVRTVLLSLDITDEVIEEATALGAELIVSHHPLFFSLKTVTDEDATGRKLLKLIKSGISVICMHTNLDAAEGGVNDVLAKKVGIAIPELLTIEGYDESGRPYCIGRFGEIGEEMSFADYLNYIKTTLSCNGLRYVSSGKRVNKVAVMGGSGGSEIQLAIKKGCDTYITSDIKYHQFIEAKEAGINIIDAGHFCTENVVIPVLESYLKNKFSTVGFVKSSRHTQTEMFF